MLIDRIKSTLLGAGFLELPSDIHAKLADWGLDSLILALWILELEHEFGINIPVIPLDSERFESLAAVEKYIIELGAT